MFSSQISMSSATQFCISWVSYKNCISKGLSRLQQDGEFVDMTLAADGYIVKVHQNIVALASPYLKAMIQSASCQHPVVFLNNITQEILSFILEYIYTGEVNIPTNAIPAFIEACKALHINGVEHLLFPKQPEPQPQAQPETLDVPVPRPADEPPPPPPLPPAPETNFAAHITINSENFNVEVIPNENIIKNHQTQLLDNDIMNYQVLTDANVVEDQKNFEPDPFPPLSDYELSSPHPDTQENQSINISSDQNVQNITFKLDMKEKEIPASAHSIDDLLPSIGNGETTQHYSISNRGSLQLLLNRFMYYCHHHAHEGRKRRWRCVDYRKLHCPAVVDTHNDIIIKRSEVHIHADHEIKIMRKFKSKKVFTSVSQAEELLTERRPKVKKRKGKQPKRGIVETISTN